MTKPVIDNSLHIIYNSISSCGLILCIQKQWDAAMTLYRRGEDSRYQIGKYWWQQHLKARSSELVRSARSGSTTLVLASNQVGEEIDQSKSCQ
jgi:hypothetical protein